LTFSGESVSVLSVAELNANVNIKLTRQAMYI
jgi:hypothetical protein